ncbi:hypothetical protein HDV02_005015 [Globomyces sp. JEL0801]|nr:hypothetical protein HDV02_005015 [Globomyces sp. JEL0801]
MPPNQSSDNPRSQPHTFIMVFRTPNTTECLYYLYPIADFEFENHKSFGYTLRVGKSLFTNDGFKLNLDAKDLNWQPEQDDIQFLNKVKSEREMMTKDLAVEQAKYERVEYSIIAEANFTDIIRLDSSLYKPTIMGPFAYLPILECYHGVVNVYHKSSGFIKFNKGAESEIISLNGDGYIEKDHGYNFPKSWIWIQTHSFSNESGSCLLISIADVPLLSDIGLLSKAVESLPVIGKKIVSKCAITGFLVNLYHSRTKQTYNLSFYTGAKIQQIDFVCSDDNGTPIQKLTTMISKGNIELKIETRRVLGTGVPLPGPCKTGKGMIMLVEESITVTVHVILKVDGKIVFDDTGHEAGMEVVGDMDRLRNRI